MHDEPCRERPSVSSPCGQQVARLSDVLGIIIGVAAVITLISVGQGVEVFVAEQFQGLGNNLLLSFLASSALTDRRASGAGQG